MPYNQRGRISSWNQRRSGKHRVQDSRGEDHMGTAEGRDASPMHCTLASKALRRGVRDKEKEGQVRGPGVRPGVRTTPI